MLSNQEKLLEFSKSIQRELAGQVAQIDSDIEGYRQSQIQSIEDEVYADCYKLIQSSITKLKLELTTERSRRLGGLKKGLLLQRDELVGMIFDDVRGQLLAFTAGAEYVPYLTKKLTDACNAYGFEHPSIFVREQDLALKGKIEAIFPGARISASKGITIGGFIIQEDGKSYIVNESLDNTLEEQKQWFYSNSGLRVTQF